MKKLMHTVQKVRGRIWRDSDMFHFARE